VRHVQNVRSQSTTNELYVRQQSFARRSIICYANATHEFTETYTKWRSKFSNIKKYATYSSFYVGLYTTSADARTAWCINIFMQWHVIIFISFICYAIESRDSSKHSLSCLNDWMAVVAQWRHNAQPPTDKNPIQLVIIHVMLRDGPEFLTSSCPLHHRSDDDEWLLSEKLHQVTVRTRGEEGERERKGWSRSSDAGGKRNVAPRSEQE